MKRKVRIYKDPNGNGGYINKTAQWLKKAQEGMQAGTPVTAGIMQQMQSAQPQQMQQQSAQGQEGDVMLQETTQMISRGMDKEDIKAQLLAKYANYEPDTAEYEDAQAQVDQYLESVYDQLGETARDETSQRLELEDVEEYQDPADVAVAEEETNPNYYYDLAQEDSADSDMEEEYDFARYGGTPNKRSFVNKTIRQLRKAQQGGDQVEEANTADVRGTEDNPTGTTGNNNMFVAGVKGQAENHFLKQQAEQMYNNQFGQGMPQPGMQQPQGDMDFAQRGGFRMRRANRKMFGSPNLPMGVTSSKYSFGPLGGVRSAEVQYNPLMMASMASMFPMMSFPGMGGYSSYSYQTPKKKYTTGRLVTEKIASTVNNQSIQDVASATNSEAASNATAGPCAEDQVKDPKSPCYDPMYAGDGPRAINQESGQVDPNAGGTSTAVTSDESSNTDPLEVNGARQVVAPKNKKDRWGRTSDSKWYGFDPVTKQWTLGVPAWTKKEEEKTTVTPARWSNVTEKIDNWGRSESDKYYGFDPKTKKWTLGEPDWLVSKTGRESLDSYYNPNKPQKKAPADNTGAWSTEGSGAGVDTGNPKDVAKAKKTPEYKKFVKERVTQKKPLGMSDAQWKKLQSQYKEFGGAIDNPEQDQFGNLQRFVYGGDEMDQMFLEDLYQPPINQSDLNYTNSKDVTDAYFKHGGLYHFDGENDSETNSTNTGKTYNQEELDKLLAEKQKTWETDYQNKNKTAQQKQQELQMQQMQKMQQYGNPMGSGVYGSGYRGAPMGGFGGYGGPGLLGAAGRLAGSFMGGRQSQFSPMGNPLQYAATAAGITKAGMLPTGMKYSKEKAEGFLGKLGLKHDKTWTLDYATPEQIKAGVKPGTTPGATTPGTTTSPTAPGLSGRDRRIAARDERKNRGIAPEADAEAFTGTLTGSTEPEGPSKNAQQELINFQANQRRQGLTLDPKTQKWVKGDSPLNNIMTSPGMSRSQGADVVTGTPGAPVNFSKSQPISAGTQSAGKSAEEIKRAYQQGTSTPTVVKKGDTTIINAAGESIDASEYAYGGYIPDYMAYGGYLPEADQGINVSSVAYQGNPVVGVEESPTWGAMQYFNQNQNIKNPDADKFKNYTVEPDDENLADCTYEQKIDPTSKCYEPQTAQLKFKEEKGPAGQKAANIMGSALDAGALLADDMNYFTENRTKYIPGMTEVARGEKQTANEGVNRGPWNARTGKEGDPQSFKGVIRKGGAIKNKKSNASGHKIDMNDFQSLLKLAGLI